MHKYLEKPKKNYKKLDKIGLKLVQNNMVLLRYPWFHTNYFIYI